MSNTQYTPEEILQIQIDFYNCQAVFDPEVDHGEQLTFETTISEWMNICDLVGPKTLAEYYHNLFKLTTPVSDLEEILLFKTNELRAFCDYISEHAIKQSVAPIVMMGKSCMTAAIFKTLISNLKERGVRTHDIKPSSEFIPLFDKCGSILIEEVNKLAPGALTKFEYLDNRIVRTAQSFFLVFVLSIIIVPIIWHFHWTLLISLAFGIVIMIIGKKNKPEKEIIGGYNTVRDLILGMQSQMEKAI